MFTSLLPFPSVTHPTSLKEGGGCKTIVLIVASVNEFDRCACAYERVSATWCLCMQSVFELTQIENDFEVALMEIP